MVYVWLSFESLESSYSFYKFTFQTHLVQFRKCFRSKLIVLRTVQIGSATNKLTPMSQMMCNEQAHSKKFDIFTSSNFKKYFYTNE